MVTTMKHFLLTLLLVGIGLGMAGAQEAPRAPMSKAEVMDLIRSSVPSRVVIESINRYGIAFRATPDELKEFRKAGANAALLDALQDAGHQELSKPINATDITVLVAEGVPGQTIVKSIRQRGIDFLPSEDHLTKFRAQGADDVLLDALRTTTPRPISKD